MRIKVIRENPFLEHPLRLLRKRLSRIIITLPTRSLYQRSPTSVNTVEHSDTLVQIAISGQPLNRAIVCHLLAAKINSNSPWLLLENFLRPSCFFRTSMDSILPLIHLNKGLCKRKYPHPSLPPRRKRTPSDSITSFPNFQCVCCFMFSTWSQSGFYAFFNFLICLFVLFWFVLIIKKNTKNSVCLCILVLVYLWMAFEIKLLTLYHLQLR